MFSSSREICTNGIIIKTKPFGFSSYYSSLHRVKYSNQLFETKEIFKEIIDSKPTSTIRNHANDKGYVINMNEYFNEFNELESIRSALSKDNNTYAIINFSETDTVSFVDTLTLKAGIEMNITTTKSSEISEPFSLITTENINFLVLPQWNRSQETERCYIKRLGLPLYRGIILMPSSRNNWICNVLYQALYHCFRELPDGETVRIPVYVVMTDWYKEFIQGLIEYDNHNDETWIKWLIPQRRIGSQDFIECLEETLCRAKSKWSFNFSVWDPCNLYFVSTDWENRMITHGICYNGYPNLRQQMLSDLMYNAKEWNSEKMEEYKDKLNGLIKNSPSITDSALYREYTSRRWEHRHYVFLSILNAITFVSIFLYGRARGQRK